MVLGKLAYRNHMREEKNYWRKTNKLSKNLIGYDSEAASESSEAAFFCPYCRCRSHSSASCLAASRARIKTSDPPLSGWFTMAISRKAFLISSSDCGR